MLDRVVWLAAKSPNNSENLDKIENCLEEKGSKQPKQPSKTSYTMYANHSLANLKTLELVVRQSMRALLDNGS